MSTFLGQGLENFIAYIDPHPEKPSQAMLEAVAIKEDALRDYAICFQDLHTYIKKGKHLATVGMTYSRDTAQIQSLKDVINTEGTTSSLVQYVNKNNQLNHLLKKENATLETLSAPELTTALESFLDTIKTAFLKFCDAIAKYIQELWKKFSDWWNNKKTQSVNADISDIENDLNKISKSLSLTEDQRALRDISTFTVQLNTLTVRDLSNAIKIFNETLEKYSNIVNTALSAERVPQFNMNLGIGEALQALNKYKTSKTKVSINGALVGGGSYVLLYQALLPSIKTFATNYALVKTNSDELLQRIQDARDCTATQYGTENSTNMYQYYLSKLTELHSTLLDIHTFLFMCIEQYTAAYKDFHKQREDVYKKYNITPAERY